MNNYVVVDTMMKRLSGLGIKLWAVLAVLGISAGLLTLSAAQIQIGSSSSSGVNGGLTSAICLVFSTVRNIIFILGLTLLILGGALYAGANLMPSSQKGGFQGYGMAMIIGGVIGVAIAVAAPFILNLVVSTNSNASGLTISSSQSSGTGIGSFSNNVCGYTGGGGSGILPLS